MIHSSLLDTSTWQQSVIHSIQIQFLTWGWWVFPNWLHKLLLNVNSHMCRCHRNNLAAVIFIWLPHISSHRYCLIYPLNFFHHSSPVCLVQATSPPAFNAMMFLSPVLCRPQVRPIAAAVMNEKQFLPRWTPRNPLPFQHAWQPTIEQL